MSTSVRDLVAEPVKTIPANTDVSAAAELMASLDVGVLPVVSEDRIVGLVTDRDLVIRSIAAGVDPKEMTVGEIATTSGLVTVDADADITQAEELMAQNRVRRLLVVDDGGFVGVLSLGDIAVQDPSKGSVGKTLDEISRSASTTGRVDDNSYEPGDDSLPM